MSFRRKLTIIVPVAIILVLAIALVAVPAGALNQLPVRPSSGGVLNNPEEPPPTPVLMPEMINYQGYLTDSGGNPINSTLEMTFSTYDVAEGGSPIWTETHPSVIVTDGLFNVLLGSINHINASHFPDINCYLGVQVGSDPEMTPRQQIVSVAYAHRCHVADTLDGWDSTHFGDGHSLDANDGEPVDVVYVDGDGKVGIGMENPSEKLSVAGIIESIEGGVKFPDGTIQMTSCENSWHLSEMGNVSFTIDGLIQDPVALYDLTQHMTSGFDPETQTSSGTASFDEFSITIKGGPLMPVLYHALVNNLSVGMVIELWPPGATEEELYMTITADNLLIADMETVATSGEPVPTMQEILFIVNNMGSTVTWLWEVGAWEATWGSGTPLETSFAYWTVGGGPEEFITEDETFLRSFSHEVMIPYNPVTGQPTGEAFYHGFKVCKVAAWRTVVNSIPAVGSTASVDEFSLNSWEYDSQSSSWVLKEYYLLDGNVGTFELEIYSDRGVLMENVSYYGPVVLWGYFEGGIEYSHDFSSAP
jgi:hypothetical protein